MRKALNRLVSFVVLAGLMTACGSQLEFPNLGLYYVAGSEAREIPQSTEFPYAVSDVDPIISEPEVKFYLTYPIPDVSTIVLQDLTRSTNVPFSVSRLDDGVLELSPGATLEDGEYCLVVGDRLRTLPDLLRWCFKIGDPVTSISTLPTEIPGNLAPNPSFELGSDRPLGWKTELYGGSVDFVWDVATKRTGTHALAITNFVVEPCERLDAPCAYGWWAMQEPIPIDVNHSYIATIWYKNTTRSSNVKLVFNLNASDQEIGSAGLHQMGPSVDWQKHSYIIESDTLSTWPIVPTHAYISLMASLDQSDTGGVWFDDVSLVEVTN